MVEQESIGTGEQEKRQRKAQQAAKPGVLLSCGHLFA